MENKSLFNSLLEDCPCFKYILMNLCSKNDLTIDESISCLSAFVHSYLNAKNMSEESLKDFASDFESYGTKVRFGWNTETKKRFLDTFSEPANLPQNPDNNLTCIEIANSVFDKIFDGDIDNSFYDRKYFCSNCFMGTLSQEKKLYDSGRLLLMSLLQDPKKTINRISAFFGEEDFEKNFERMLSHEAVLCIDISKDRSGFSLPHFVDLQYHIINCYQKYMAEQSKYERNSFLDYVCKEFCNYPLFEQLVSKKKLNAYYVRPEAALDAILNYFDMPDKETFIQSVQEFEIPEDIEGFSPYLELLKVDVDSKKDDAIIDTESDNRVDNAYEVPVSVNETADDSADKELPKHSDDKAEQDNSTDSEDNDKPETEPSDSETKDEKAAETETGNDNNSGENEPAVSDMNTSVNTPDPEHVEDKKSQEDIDEESQEDEDYSFKWVNGVRVFKTKEARDKSLMAMGFDLCRSENAILYNDTLTPPRRYMNDTSPDVIFPMRLLSDKNKKPCRTPDEKIRRPQAIPLNTQRNIENFIWDFEHNDDCMPVECLADEDKAFYLFFYCDYSTKSYYAYINWLQEYNEKDDFSKELMPKVREMITGKKYAKISLYPYLLLSVCSFPGVDLDIQNFFSIMNAKDMLDGYDGKDLREIVDGIYHNPEIEKRLTVEYPYCIFYYKLIYEHLRHKIESQEVRRELWEKIVARDDALGRSYLLRQNIKNPGVLFSVQGPNSFEFFDRIDKTCHGCYLNGLILKFSFRSKKHPEIVKKYPLEIVELYGKWGHARRSYATIIGIGERSITLFIPDLNHIGIPDYKEQIFTQFYGDYININLKRKHFNYVVNGDIRINIHEINADTLEEVDDKERIGYGYFSESDN